MITHKQYIAMLPRIAAQSDDPDTQTAAILALGRGPVICGANEVPHRLKITKVRTTSPAKYNWIMHAERSVIAEAAARGVRTQGSTMYLNWFPCAACAQIMIQAGVTTLHADSAAYETRRTDPRYGFALSMEMLVEAGITIRWH